jgi:hypothetical protein
MPDWILAPICIIILVGFIGYALRQGTKVEPDRNNSNSDRASLARMEFRAMVDPQMAAGILFE